MNNVIIENREEGIFISVNTRLCVHVASVYLDMNTVRKVGGDAGADPGVNENEIV